MQTELSIIGAMLLITGGLLAMWIWQIAQIRKSIYQFNVTTQALRNLLDEQKKDGTS